MAPIPILTGLSEIAARYDSVICDVWGVVHDGRHHDPAATDALRRFRDTQGPVVLLSNAPRLSSGVQAQFDRIGVPHGFYDAILTSGEATRADLARRSATATLPMFYLGPDRDRPMFEGLNLKLTSADEAAVVLCTGLFDDDTETPDDYRAMLEEFKTRKLPFLCANPDLVVQRGDRLVYCAGAIAQLYEEMGGQAIYYGKPHPPVFHAALERLRAARAGIAKTLVIGDGPGTDVKGANGVGLDVLFIGGGIHAAETRTNPASMIEVLAKCGLTAAAAMASLTW